MRLTFNIMRQQANTWTWS